MGRLREMSWVIVAHVWVSPFPTPPLTSLPPPSSLTPSLPPPLSLYSQISLFSCCGTLYWTLSSMPASSFALLSPPPSLQGITKYGCIYLVYYNTNTVPSSIQLVWLGVLFFFDSRNSKTKQHTVTKILIYRPRHLDKHYYSNEIL